MADAYGVDAWAPQRAEISNPCRRRESRKKFGLCAPSQRLGCSGRFAGMSFIDDWEIEKAKSLFRRFQFRAPKPSEIVQIGGLEKPVIALGVGIADSIGYKAFGDGKLYLHNFEGQRPKVFVSADGKQVYFLDGGYRFTERGFIG
jgi:hypothetical protein